MSIETSSASAAAKPPSSGTAGTGKSPGTGKGAASSSLGFGAILAAEEVPVANPQTSDQTENFESKVPLAPVEYAQPAINLIANIPVMADPSQTLNTADASTATDSMGQAATLLPLVSTFAGGMPSPADSGSPASVPTSSVQAQAHPGQALATAVFAPAQTLEKPVTADVALAATGTTAKTGKAAKPSTNLADAAPVMSQADAGKALDTKFFAAMEAVKSMQFAKEPLPAAQGAMLLSSVATDLTKPEKVAGNTDAMALTYSPNAPTLGTTSYASTAVSDVAGMSPEMQVAEQVTYWITQDVQNAELTLDGLGSSPVEVSIRMSGNEAQVFFRTDELQTRDLLEGAASHLQELLQSEGLVLSGVSVGASGSGSAGEGQQRPSQGGRQTTLVQAVPEPVAPRKLSTGTQGRSLDLFV